MFGHLLRGPLALLREVWAGEWKASPELNADSEKYLTDLKSKLEDAKTYAEQHSEVAQNRYVRY